MLVQHLSLEVLMLDWMRRWLACLSVTASLCGESGVAQAGEIGIWYETFGERDRPALLLIMGRAGQGIVWPTELCQRLARGGFYVIRYDQRDSGLSSYVDFGKTPYDLSDMAKDAVGLLDALQIERAHLFGCSMGVAIAELIAVHFPSRAVSLALLGGCFDSRPYNRAMAKLPPEPGALSGPRKAYMEEAWKIVEWTPTTDEERVEQKMQIWRLISGHRFPLEEATTREMLRHYIARAVHPDGPANYWLALQASEEMILQAHSRIEVPTLIFYGSEDPLMGPDHAAAFCATIKHATYHLVEGLGHLPHPHFAEKFSYSPDPDEIESLTSIDERVSQFLQETHLEDQREEPLVRNHLVVSHYGVLKTLFMSDAFKRGFDIDYRAHDIKNCGIVIIEVDEDGARVVATQGLSFKKA